MAKTTPAPRTRAAVVAAPLDLPAASTSASTDAKRLSLMLDANEGFDVDRLRERPSSAAKLKKALTPDVLKELGIVPGAALPAADAAKADAAMNRQMMEGVLNMLYDGIASAAVVNLTSRGVPEQIATLARLVDEEKRMMRETHLALLDKYDLLGGKYAVEWNAAGSVAVVCMAKFAAIKSALAALPATAEHKSAA